MKEDRFGIRVSPEQKEIIEKHAVRHGLTMSVFMLAAADFFVKNPKTASVWIERYLRKE
jgi:hypothetical protein